MYITALKLCSGQTIHTDKNNQNMGQDRVMVLCQCNSPSPHKFIVSSQPLVYSSRYVSDKTSDERKDGWTETIT